VTAEAPTTRKSAAQHPKASAAQVTLPERITLVRRHPMMPLWRQAQTRFGRTTVGLQSEQSDEPSTEQFEEVDHRGKATALLACASPDEIFSRHG
jgi:hypothetical protein